MTNTFHTFSIFINAKEIQAIDIYDYDLYKMREYITNELKKLMIKMKNDHTRFIEIDLHIYNKLKYDQIKKLNDELTERGFKIDYENQICTKIYNFEDIDFNLYSMMPYYMRIHW